MRSIPLFFFVFVVGVNSDDYINEVQGRCYVTKKSYTCAKYKIFKYIDDYHLGNVSLTSDSSVRFVTIPSVNISDAHVFEESRQYFQEDSEFVKVLKFMKRRMAKFFTEQGLSLELPDEVEVVSEARGSVRGKGKKEKKMLILPILILLKLFKVKILTALILAGVLVIKKMLITAAFLLPGVISAIKLHCKAQQYHVVPYHVNEDHYTHDHEHEHEDEYGLSGWGGDKHYFDKRKRYSHL